MQFTFNSDLNTWPDTTLPLEKGCEGKDQVCIVGV